MKFIVKFILLFSTFMLVNLSNAAEVVQAKTKLDNKYNCLSKRNQIIKRISKVPTCSQNSDCNYFDYGYPWQNGVCLKAIISTAEEGRNITNLAIIEEFNKNCVYNNKERKEQFTKFREKLTTSKCGKLARAYCLKGLCRTEGYIIHDQPDAIIRETTGDVDMKTYLQNNK